MGGTDGVSLEMMKRRTLLEGMGHQVAICSASNWADFHIAALEFDSGEVRKMMRNLFGPRIVDFAGEAELEEALVGLRKVTGGQIVIDGIDLTNADPKKFIEQNLGHIPSDRYNMGMLSDFTVAENMVLATHENFLKNGLLDNQKINDFSQTLVKKFDVRTPGIDTLAGKLSGGNIQKMILARELADQPKVLIAAQPTRGLDISATEFIHEFLISQRDQGTAILLISTELNEVFALSDRVVVLCEGEIVGESATEEADLAKIGLMMCGEKVDLPEYLNIPEQETGS